MSSEDKKKSLEKSKQERIQHELINLVMRQTEYNYETSSEKLKENNNNYELVIKEYMGIKPKEEPKLKSINQQIYSEIRGMMNDASMRFYRNKEMQEKIEMTKQIRQAQMIKYARDLSNQKMDISNQVIDMSNQVIDMSNN